MPRSPGTTWVRIAILVQIVAFPIAAHATVCYRPQQPAGCFASCPPNAIGCVAVTCETTSGCPIPPAPPPDEDLPFIRVQPTIKFAPPSFQFSQLEARKVGGGVSIISIPWIGEYISAAYRYAVPSGAIIAVVVMMVAGIRWMTSGGGDGKSVALEWIRNAVIGLVFLLASYVILRTVNPNLVALPQLQVRVASREELVEESEPDSVVGTETFDVTTPRGTGLSGSATFDRALLPAVQAAGVAANAKGFGILITSGYRSVDDQERLIRENCQNPPGSQTCNPKPGRPTTCILRSGPASCPHTTGRAIDAWGTYKGKQCILQKTCLADKNACRANACQAAVMSAMRGQGFCNLASEPWHFELPKMSAHCS